MLVDSSDAIDLAGLSGVGSWDESKVNEFIWLWSTLDLQSKIDFQNERISFLPDCCHSAGQVIPD